MMRPRRIEHIGNLTKAATSILRMLLGENTARIVTGSQIVDVKKLLRVAKHRIVYPGGCGNKKDSDIEKQPEADTDGCPHRRILVGGKHPMNSKKRTKQLIRKYQVQKQNLNADKISKLG